MDNGNGENSWTDFPDSDEYVDFAGRVRHFTLRLVELASGFRLTAIENTESENGYQFDTYSRSDVAEALGDMRKKVRRLLSVRHLIEEDGQLHPTHDRLRGRIGHGGVIIDGTFLAFDELSAMLQTYEGFQFDLTLVEPTDDIFGA